tara:strand:- start:914 stop:1147 length:234 start_codon:yes stop_codon:yes gene_type:complete
MKIKEAVWFIFSIENLKNKQDFKAWCGDMGFKKLYLYVKNLAPEHWNRILIPEASVRNYAQNMLLDYKRTSESIRYL